jgi:Polyketide cyclase / dehydrase and lipid transport
MAGDEGPGPGGGIRGIGGVVATARESIVVNRACAETFAYLTDPRTRHEWQPQVARIELLRDGEVGAGTQAVEVRRMFGREVRVPFEITRHEPPHRQDIRTTGGPIRPTGVLRCELQSDGTLVSYEFTFTGPAAWFFARTISRNMKAALARTKKRLESQ